VRHIDEIRTEIEELSERREELWHRLSEGHDVAVAAEVRRLDERLNVLWDEQRVTRARLRFGDPANILKRARLEERLERAA
jgi:hypothetical protein